MVSGPSLFLVFSMMIECGPVPIQEEEKSSIVELAHASRSLMLASMDFESVSISKCVTYWDQGEPAPGKSRTVFVKFYGLFPHRIQTEKYRERYSIRCETTEHFRDDSKVEGRDSCSEELERFMRYQNLDHEVRLRGSVSLEDATAYLDYLMDYDFGQKKQARVDDMLKQIAWVDVLTIRGRTVYQASYAHGGCATSTFEAPAIMGDIPVFGEVAENMITC